MSFGHVASGTKYQILPIPGFNGYFADSQGDIWSGKQKRFKKIQPWIAGRVKDGKGYKMVMMSRDRTKATEAKVYVHRAVLLTFKGPGADGMECRHLNGNPRDSRPVNLQWGTGSENAIDSVNHGVCPLSASNRSDKFYGDGHHKAKITDRDAIDIVEDFIQGRDVRDIAGERGIQANAVRFLIDGKSWKRVTGMSPVPGGACTARKRFADPDALRRFLGFNPVHPPSD